MGAMNRGGIGLSYRPGWRNSFLGINSGAPYKFKNTGSVRYASEYRKEGTEAESKGKHGVWDPMPELTITSPYVLSKVDYNTFTMGNPVPESTLTLIQSRP
jgi:hypothetical protein